MKCNKSIWNFIKKHSTGCLMSSCFCGITKYKHTRRNQNKTHTHHSTRARLWTSLAVLFTLARTLGLRISEEFLEMLDEFGVGDFATIGHHIFEDFILR